jgi:hypothetical protein
MYIYMGTIIYKNLHYLLVFKKQKHLLNTAIQEYLKQELRKKALVPYKKPNTYIIPFINRI